MSLDPNELYERIRAGVADGVSDSLSDLGKDVAESVNVVSKRIDNLSTKLTDRLDQQSKTLKASIDKSTSSTDNLKDVIKLTSKDIINSVKASSNKKELKDVSQALANIHKDTAAQAKNLAGLTKSMDGVTKSNKLIKDALTDLKGMTAVRNKQDQIDSENLATIANSMGKLATAKQVNDLFKANANAQREKVSDHSSGIMSFLKTATAVVAGLAGVIGIVKYGSKIKQWAGNTIDVFDNPGRVAAKAGIPGLTPAIRARTEGSINADLDRINKATTPEEKGRWYARRAEDFEDNIDILKDWVAEEKGKASRDEELIKRLDKLISVTEEKLDKIKNEMSEQPANLADKLKQGVVDMATKADIAISTLSRSLFKSMGFPDDFWVQELIDKGGFRQTARMVTGLNVKPGGMKQFNSKAPPYMERFMKEFGLTQEQAAGVFGNLGHESRGLTSGIQEGDPKKGPGGLGWAQWTGPRREAFKAYLARTGQSLYSDEANYGFFVEEIRKSREYMSGINKLKKVNDPFVALRMWHDIYERSADVKNGKIVKPKLWASREAYTRASTRFKLPKSQVTMASYEEEEEEEDTSEDQEAKKAEAAEIAAYQKSTEAESSNPMGVLGSGILGSWKGLKGAVEWAKKTGRERVDQIRKFGQWRRDHIDKPIIENVKESWDYIKNNKTVKAIGQQAKEGVDWVSKNTTVGKTVSRAADKVIDKSNDLYDYVKSREFKVAPFEGPIGKSILRSVEKAFGLSPGEAKGFVDILVDKVLKDNKEAEKGGKDTEAQEGGSQGTEGEAVEGEGEAAPLELPNIPMGKDIPAVVSAMEAVKVAMESRTPGMVSKQPYDLWHGSSRPYMGNGTFDNVKQHAREGKQAFGSLFESVKNDAEAIARGEWINKFKTPVEPTPSGQQSGGNGQTTNVYGGGGGQDKSNLTSLSQIPMVPFDLELANQNTGKTV